MNKTTLKALLNVRNLNQSNLAQRAGLSRQVVSHWFMQPTDEINVHSRNLQKVASCLGVTTDDLSRPLPLTGEPERKTLETALLWDRLYPNLEAFISAMIRGQPSALARLVQVYGLYQSEMILGKKIWEKFGEYRLKIAPAQRRQAEVLWNLRKNQA